MVDKRFFKKRSFESLIEFANSRQATEPEENSFYVKGSQVPPFQHSRPAEEPEPESSIAPDRQIERESAAHRPNPWSSIPDQQIKRESATYLPNPPSSTLLDYYKILFKRKWLIALCALAILIPAAVWLWTTTPIYETEAAIIYEEANDTAFLLDLGQSFYSKSAVLNMVEQIKSRSLADEVARSLPEDIVQTFQFPDDPPASFSTEKFISGTIRENLTVENVRGADIIKIKILASNPMAAKTIANAYVDHITEWFLQKNKKEISNIRNFVEGQVSVFQEKLRTAEDALLQYREQNAVTTLSAASTEMLTNMTDVEVAYNEAKTEREALEQRRRFIEQKKQELMPSLVISNNETSQRLKGDLMALERQYANLQSQSGAENQETLATLKERINQSKQDLINELMKSGVRENLADPLSQIRSLLQESITLDMDLETRKAREQGLKNTLNEYNYALQQLPEQEMALARLIRDKEVNDKIYALLLEKREEARITEAGKVGDVRVVDYAEVPAQPIKPQKKKMLVIAFVLGLSLGAGLSFLLESLDNSVKSDQDIERYLGLPVIATIPTIANDGKLAKIGKKEGGRDSYHSKLLSQVMTKSYIFEAYRSLQLNFTFLNPDKKLKTILITSPEPGAGKTITSLNIAQFYAREGTRTLVIDCDLRRPMVHTALNLKQEPGLSNYLVDKSTGLDAYLQSVDEANLKNLKILTCGTLPPNPSELLGSKRMEDLLADIAGTYEFVILDAPPIISVADAVILGQDVDGVLLVLRARKTSSEAAVKAKKILENSRINIIGTLLNDVDLKNTYGYYKDYYYYSDKKTL